MSEAKTNRDRIAHKIRGLLTKTTDAGCTESEAMAAAELATKLMADYDLTYSDLSMDFETAVRSERYGARPKMFHLDGQQRHEVAGCIGEIGTFFDCLAFIFHDGNLLFFGSAEDTDRAHKLTDLLRMAIDGEWARYYSAPDRDLAVHGRTLRTSFTTGMVDRLNARLTELKAQRSKSSSTGSALVVIRTEVVRERWQAYAADKGLTVKHPKPKRPKIKSPTAYMAGQDAGGRVELG